MRVSARWLALLPLGAAAIAAAILWRRGAPADAPPPAPPGPTRFERVIDVDAFQRGNLHTHTSLSDGDSKPDAVVRWYRDNGYSFVALTDHNQRVDPALFEPLQTPGFVVIAGEEISMTAEGRPVHVNALCTRQTIGGGHFPTKVAALRWAIRRVRVEGGVALINHPNFEWALSASDIAAAPAQLLEIWSGHPYVRTAGDATHPSHEAIWDTVLTSGRELAGVAVDDMHRLVPTSNSPPGAPGQGFVEVFSRETSRAAICAALSRGWLYASTGATLRRLVVSGDSFSVWPASTGAVVEFLGAGGRLLDRQRLLTGRASYRLRGGERYVRARITQPDGKRAWTQAYVTVE